MLDFEIPADLEQLMNCGTDGDKFKVTKLLTVAEIPGRLDGMLIWTRSVCIQTAVTDLFSIPKNASAPWIWTLGTSTRCLTCITR